ncbi:YcaO-like family protein [Streptomyces sp. DSM 44915]|uniref:YcaO-like family protein n=1 Tax=Streptomyces chisholmiae TaxID=3075540 RepID=A0ABU2JND1_9ACTN|nr:YcaO-like family protein [Streptomyces sp. DSM 44915]MDT0266501.1 YcaO-like family protein [Streptomyces sp. DSM 44915]
MLDSATPGRAAGQQFGERTHSVERAWLHGLAAADELGLAARHTPVPETEPDAWRCVLRRHGTPARLGEGHGKGAEGPARVGALFAALAHHLSGDVPDWPGTRLRQAHALPIGEPARDQAVARLRDEPDAPLLCLPYRSLTGVDLLDLPVFLATPDYLDLAAPARAALGDQHGYRTVRRYASPVGWAAGCTPEEATVHALTQVVERDAAARVLTERLGPAGAAPLRVLEPRSLPCPLSALLRGAEERLGQRVALLEITAETGIPAYWAWTPSPPGAPDRLRGLGASLSPYLAVERALHELIASQAVLVARPPAARRPGPVRCPRFDLAPALRVARHVPFLDAEAPATPEAHLAALLGRLGQAGLTAWSWARYTSPHLSVIHVAVPGARRLPAADDGQADQADRADLAGTPGQVRLDATSG